MRRGQASPAGARKGGALTRAIARQNGKRPDSAARARDSPASDTVSFGGRSSPGSEKPGAQRPSSAPGRRSFEPPSRASPAGSVGAPQVERQSSDSGLLKAKSVLVVEEAGSPSKLRDKARAVGMMKRAQTAVLASPEEPTDVDLLLKKTSFAPEVESDQSKRAQSVPSSPDNKSSQPLTSDSLPQGPPRRNVITPTPDPSDDGPRPRSKQSEIPQRRTALIAMATGSAGDTADKIKSLFGAGNRVDPKVWTAWVENLAHSGQSQPMAGHFGEVDHESKRQKEATDKEHMEFLTEDYFLQDLDHGKDPEKMGKSKGRPKKPMSTAFTDRGVRMREGVATKHLLRMDPQSYEDEGPTKHKAGCNCSVCQPIHIHPAGQPTHACAHNVVADPVKVKVGKHNYPQAHSPGVRKALEYAQGSAHEHELLFQQSMTRKGRVQPDTSSTTAGQYRRPKTEAMVKKSPEGGNPTLQRSDASYILNPRESDPPHPHDRICNHRKAGGEFKEGYSQECTRFAVKWNQDLYRFDVLSYGGDAIRPLFRAGSCPPNQSANPITGDVKDNVKSPRRKTEHEQKGRDKAGKAVRMLTNHTDLDAQAKEDRENRMQVDENFAKLCKAGVELGSKRAAEVSKIKATQFRHLSTNVANALKWDD